MIDFVATWSAQTELPATRLLGWLGLGASKYFDWKQRYGKANEHNAQVPRDHWLEPWEHEAIVDFARAHPLDGYRRLTFMMLDQDVVGREPGLGVSGAREGWPAPALERDAQQEGHGVRAAAGAP